MDILFKNNFHLSLYGISGIAVDQNWADTGMKLMNQMWQQVKGLNLQNKGINVWVYEPGNKMFTGVELLAPPPAGTSLEQREVCLPSYAYYKHIGPYEKIKEVFPKLKAELDQKGINHRLPYLEIYGHWTEDTSRLETELLWCLQ